MTDKHQCGNCRFWSEMCAQSIGCGPVEAVCLSGDGPKAGRFVKETTTCRAWKSGHFGAVDQPPDYGEGARRMYAAEERWQ